jgi:hypothetical protein
MKKEEINYLYKHRVTGAVNYFLKVLEERAKEIAEDGVILNCFHVAMNMAVTVFPNILENKVDISIQDENFYYRAKSAIQEHIEEGEVSPKLWSREICYLILLCSLDSYLTRVREKESFAEYVCKSSRVLSLIKRIQEGEFDETLNAWMSHNETYG